MVNIFCTNAVGGPQKVISNLIKGLNLINVPYELNNLKYEKTICINAPHNNLPDDCFMGPNLFVVPSQNEALCNKHKNFIVPSEWVKNLYESFPIMNNKNIFVYPSGIDTELFNISKNRKRQCVIYCKNTSDEIINKTKKKVSEYGYEYKTITYGSYNEDEYKKIIDESEFAVFLTNTESQGIAYLEMLSTNTPCYILEKDVWDDMPNIKCPASSAPYFSEECGIKHTSFELFDVFIKNLNNYKPRKYVLSNFKLEDAATKLLNILYKEQT